MRSGSERGEMGGTFLAPGHPPTTATSAWPDGHWEEVMPLLLWLALLVEAPSVSST